MTRGKMQLRLWHLALAVVCISLLMAIDSSRLHVGSKVLVLVFAAVVLAISRLADEHWLRVGTWASGLYPAFSPLAVCTTWVVAGFALGLRPRANADDPARIGTLVAVVRWGAWQLIDFEPVMGLLCIGLVGASVVVSLIKKNPYTFENLLIFVVPTCSWLTWRVSSRGTQGGCHLVF